MKLRGNQEELKKFEEEEKEIKEKIKGSGGGREKEWGTLF